jgi:glucose-1-phosphate thymidylyltransferase
MFYIYINKYKLFTNNNIKNIIFINYIFIKMKGVILAGGEGTRLYPCTIVVNKHLLPIYDQPMIYYPIKTLVQAGCDEILIVTGGKNPGEFMKLLKNGQEFGLKSILYAYQEKSGGIAEALNLAKSFIGNSNFCLILGDNLIFDDLSSHLTKFMTEPTGSAKIFIKEIENPKSFGVAEIHDGKVISIIEKPTNPKSNFAVIGVYCYDPTVFEIISTLKPSNRGELEITDVNAEYIRRGSLTYAKLDSEWLDTGSFASLYEANRIIADRRQS